MRLVAPINLFRVFVLLAAQYVHAQTEVASTSFDQADAKLNSTYKQSLLRFKGKDEPLRRAERAWITFSNKNEAVLSALNQEGRVSKKVMDLAVMLEVDFRSRHLWIYFCDSTMPATDRREYQDKDKELERIYSDCMRVATGRVQTLLRDAERAWITYRDADSASIMACYDLPRVEYSSAAHLTELRISMLSIILKLANNPQSAIPNPQSEPVSTPPPPTRVEEPPVSPEITKKANRLQEESKALLTKFLAQGENPFFKKGESIKQAPDLPADVAETTVRLSSEIDQFVQNNPPQKIVTPILGEFSAISLLKNWSIFLQELKSGNVFDAGKKLRTALSTKSDAPAVYRPLWDAVGNWESAYITDEPKFQDHVHKAGGMAEKGKTSEAIKEYQAAYDIIPNAPILDQIKKTREQSLGL